MTKKLSMLEILDGLGKVGIISKKLFLKLATKPRILELENFSLVKYSDSIFKAYTLTQKGKKLWIKKNDPKNKNIIYHSSHFNSEHDLRLSDFFFKLKASERESWITEKDIALRFGIGEHCIDGLYKDEKLKIWVCVESIGRSYSRKRIEEKKRIFREVLKKKGAAKLVLLHPESSPFFCENSNENEFLRENGLLPNGDTKTKKIKT